MRTLFSYPPFYRKRNFSKRHQLVLGSNFPVIWIWKTDGLETPKKKNCDSAPLRRKYGWGCSVSFFGTPPDWRFLPPVLSKTKLFKKTSARIGLELFSNLDLENRWTRNAEKENRDSSPLRRKYGWGCSVSFFGTPPDWRFLPPVLSKTTLFKKTSARIGLELSSNLDLENRWTRNAEKQNRDSAPLRRKYGWGCSVAFFAFLLIGVHVIPKGRRRAPALRAE